MATIALFGAGGKIGARMAAELSATEHETRLVDPDPAAAARLAADGTPCVDAAVAVRGADIVVLSVPDRILGRLAAELAPALDAGTMLVLLDAAAPYSGLLPARPDLTYLITHPCHPPLFPNGLVSSAHADHFGGVAPQDAVATLMQGPESAWPLAEALVRAIWAPVTDVHRISLEHMAILEPGLVEVTSLTLLTAVRDALDRVIAAGVPEVAARAFLMGHLHVELAMLFGYTDAELSDGAKAAVERSLTRLLQPGWIEAVDPPAVRRATDEILGIA